MIRTKAVAKSGLSEPLKSAVQSISCKLVSQFSTSPVGKRRVLFLQQTRPKFGLRAYAPLKS